MAQSVAAAIEHPVSGVAATEIDDAQTGLATFVWLRTVGGCVTAALAVAPWSTIDDLQAEERAAAITVGQTRQVIDRRSVELACVIRTAALGVAVECSGALGRVAMAMASQARFSDSAPTASTGRRACAAGTRRRAATAGRRARARSAGGRSRRWSAAADQDEPDGHLDWHDPHPMPPLHRLTAFEVCCLVTRNEVERRCQRFAHHAHRRRASAMRAR
jgi:hypothetical protein